MPQTNRGKEGSDDRLFGSTSMQNKMQKAVFDLSFLLERGYSEKSSKELIGNRYKLNQRQIKGIAGMSASSSSVQLRNEKRLNSENLQDQVVLLDGFNVLIILESILSNGYVFKGMDGSYRDLSSVHGSYKRVSQTETALHIVGDFLERLNLGKAIWVFDKPVSNSGRLKSMLTELAKRKNYDWEILLDYNPDKYLVENKGICITSDAWILEHCESWFNLIEELFQEKLIESEFVVSFSE